MGYIDYNSLPRNHLFRLVNFRIDKGIRLEWFLGA